MRPNNRPPCRVEFQPPVTAKKQVYTAARPCFVRQRRRVKRAQRKLLPWCTRDRRARLLSASAVPVDAASVMHARLPNGG